MDTKKRHHHRASNHHVDVLDDSVPVDRSGGQGHRAPRERRWRRRRKRSVVLRPSRDDDDSPAAGRQRGSGVRRRWRASSRETHGRESVVRDARSGCFFFCCFCLTFRRRRGLARVPRGGRGNPKSSTFSLSLSLSLSLRERAVERVVD